LTAAKGEEYRSVSPGVLESTQSLFQSDWRSVNTPSDIPVHDEDALVERLSRGLSRSNQEVVFLVGAAFSAPWVPDSPGVPNVDGVIDLIRREFEGETRQLALFDGALSGAGRRRYQAAFQFLQGRRGQDVVNEVVRKAVMSARQDSGAEAFTKVHSRADIEDASRFIDNDTQGWVVSPGTKSLGDLAVRYPERFGKWILTTNFDPLVEVAIRRSGGSHLKTILQSDGDFTQTEGSGCHVVHLHGYWFGSDTLHTARQLSQSRPRLRNSLGFLLRKRIVVVCGYSGWDDVFTEALMDIVRDDAAFPEILWTLHSPGRDLDSDLIGLLEPGIDRGRVNLYAGVDCHRLLPRLCQVWSELQAAAPLPPVRQSNPVRVNDAVRAQIIDRPKSQTVLEGDDEDRPPLVEICVGRELELRAIAESAARVVFITGLGGQGKSTLAARYFAEVQKKRAFTYYVWRDCKEEGERFENQLASVIEKLSSGKLSGKDLAEQSADALVQILASLICDIRVLFVFDNVDHYVDLDTGKMVGGVSTFIESLLADRSSSQVVFTCRPSIGYDHPLILSSHLSGIDINATSRLFKERGASANETEIADAHHLTDGHAFWLDLLAIQVARPGSEIRLTNLVNEIRVGRGPLPEKTLKSIWTTLREREQKVLRALAETVKPVTEAEIGDYLRHDINYGKVLKALRTVRALNLVVVKRHASAPDVLELHPMVRGFIHQNFAPHERIAFIDGIIKVYKQFIGSHKSQLTQGPPLTLLQYWTENAELDIAARKLADAFLILAEVADAFASGAYPREFCRITRLLLSATEWVKEHSRYKTFEKVFQVHVELLSYLGEYVEVGELLDKYEATVPDRDSRYIHYCEMRCHSKWVRGDFSEAVEWGKIGEALKSTGVDTGYDVAHTLALAQRDAGHPEVALPMFLEERPLSEVVDPEELDEVRGGGAYYGNIGRCLHFLGQTDSALVCYQKSALLIEKDPKNERVLNQGYIRAWIGELLASRGQIRLANVFLLAAYTKWEHVAPPKAGKVLVMQRQLESGRLDAARSDPGELEKICLDWILGRSLDAEFRESAPFARRALQPDPRVTDQPS
jgi:tetratricopeptide (TPR) repeat protein